MKAIITVLLGKPIAADSKLDQEKALADMLRPYLSQITGALRGFQPVVSVNYEVEDEDATPLVRIKEGKYINLSEPVVVKELADMGLKYICGMDTDCSCSAAMHDKQMKIEMAYFKKWK